MSNSDRVVLALGGAGTVGSGIVKALLDKGKLPGITLAPRGTPSALPRGHAEEFFLIYR